MNIQDDKQRLRTEIDLEIAMKTALAEGQVLAYKILDKKRKALHIKRNKLDQKEFDTIQREGKESQAEVRRLNDEISDKLRNVDQVSSLQLFIILENTTVSQKRGVLNALLSVGNDVDELVRIVVNTIASINNNSTNPVNHIEGLRPLPQSTDEWREAWTKLQSFPITGTPQIVEVQQAIQTIKEEIRGNVERFDDEFLGLLFKL